MVVSEAKSDARHETDVLNTLPLKKKGKGPEKRVGFTARQLYDCLYEWEKSLVYTTQYENVNNTCKYK